MKSFLVVFLLGMSLASLADDSIHFAPDQRECQKAGIRTYHPAGEFRACGFIHKMSFENFSALDKNWEGIFISRSSFVNSNWRNVSLKGADAWASRFDNSSFVNCDLSIMEFSLASLKKTAFDTVKLESTIFRAAQLQEAKFKNVDLSSIPFDEADLTNAVFEDVTLSGTSFVGANLTGTRFIDVKLNYPVAWPEGYTPTFITTKAEGPNPATMIWLLIGASLIAAIVMVRSYRMRK